MKKRIFLACDFSTKQEVIDVVEKVKNDICGIKIGLQYVTSTGIDGIKVLSKFNLPIMYDVKAFDIKNTLVAFAKSLKKIGVSYATVHLLNGEETLREAVKNAEDVKLIGVSVLTSFTDSDSKKLGFSNTVDEQVEKLTRIAVASNLHGVVCSPHEVKIIKKISPHLICFTPGVRIGTEKHDQKRTMSAKEAIYEGADFLIIGRPITLGEHPEKNIKKIINSLH